MEADAASASQAVSAPKKGRRGLARKNKTPPSVNVAEPSSHHTSSVYSSCVSRGYINKMREITAVQGVEREKGDVADSSSVIDIHDKETSASGDNLKTGPVEAEIVDSSQEDKQNTTRAAVVGESLELIPVEGECSEGDDDLDIDLATAANSLRSPTPPPVGEVCSNPNRKHRMNRKLSSALKTLNKVKGALDKEPLTTPFTKSRRKRGVKGKLDIETSLVDLGPVTKTVMEVKVRYLTSLYKIPLKMTDPFHKLLHHLSAATSQQEQYLNLFLNDQVLSLSKTPQQIGLSVADIIECHCIQESKSGQGSESLNLLVQCSNSKRKTSIKVAVRQPMQEVLESYAQQAGIDAAAFMFRFDGDGVDGQDTAFALDMEDGDILDLVPASSRNHRSAWQNSVIDLS